jgi:hypothetical protein
LKKVYVLINSQYGPKQTDLDTLVKLNSLGMNYQIVLTKFDKVDPLIWKHMEIVLGTNNIAMNNMAALRTKLGPACDETILAVCYTRSRKWGFADLRASVAKACNLFGEEYDKEYIEKLQDTPILEDEQEEKVEERVIDWERGRGQKGFIFRKAALDTNPMRGPVRGTDKMMKRGNFRW